jgi:hypothetical protein
MSTRLLNELTEAYAKVDALTVEIEQLTKLKEMVLSWWCVGNSRDCIGQHAEWVSGTQWRCDRCESVRKLLQTKNCTCDPDDNLIAQGCPTHDPYVTDKDSQPKHERFTVDHIDIPERRPANKSHICPNCCCLPCSCLQEKNNG